jgi:hypothetical protein
MIDFNQTEVDVIEDIEEYQTVPGAIILVLRVVVMLCFLVALRDTMMHEFSQVVGKPSCHQGFNVVILLNIFTEQIDENGNFDFK